MDTVLFIPESLSVDLLARNDGEGSELEIGATLRANTPLPTGTILQPELGFFRLGHLEVYKTLDTRDVRFKYGCYDDVSMEEDRMVRHCNWVRFLRQAQCSRDVNLLAERSADTGDVIYRVISHVPVGGELLVHFDCDPDLPSERCLASVHTGLTLTREYGVFEEMLRNAGSFSSSSSPVSPLTSSNPPALTLMTSPIKTAWQPRHVTSPADHVSNFMPQQVLNQMRETTNVATSRYLSTPADVTTCRRASLPVPDYNFYNWSGEGEDGDEDNEEGTGANPIDLTWSPPVSRHSPSVVTKILPVVTTISDKEDVNDDAFYNGCDVSDRLTASDDVKTRRTFESKMATTGEAGATPSSQRREKTLLPSDTCGKKFDRESLPIRDTRTHTENGPIQSNKRVAMEIDNKIRVMQDEGDNPVPVSSDAPPSPDASSNDHEQLKQEHDLDETAPASRDLGAELGTTSGSQPQACPVCGKSIAHRLQRHMISHKESPKVRRFHCPDCQKAFKFKHHLKEHAKIHSREKPNNCPNCGKQFIHSGYYSRHMRSKKCRFVNYRAKESATSSEGKGKVAAGDMNDASPYKGHQQDHQDAPPPQTLPTLPSGSSPVYRPGIYPSRELLACAHRLSTTSSSWSSYLQTQAQIQAAAAAAAVGRPLPCPFSNNALLTSTALTRPNMMAAEVAAAALRKKSDKMSLGSIGNSRTEGGEDDQSLRVMKIIQENTEADEEENKKHKASGDEEGIPSHDVDDSKLNSNNKTAPNAKYIPSVPIVHQLHRQQQHFNTSSSSSSRHQLYHSQQSRAQRVLHFDEGHQVTHASQSVTEEKGCSEPLDLSVQCKNNSSKSASSA